MPAGSGGRTGGSGAFSSFQHTQSLSRAYNLTHQTEGSGSHDRSTARARTRVAEALIMETTLPLPTPRTDQPLTLERQLSTRYVPTQIPFASLRCAELLSAADVAELAYLFDVYNVLPNGTNQEGGTSSGTGTEEGSETTTTTAAAAGGGAGNSLGGRAVSARSATPGRQRTASLTPISSPSPSSRHTPPSTALSTKPNRPAVSRGGPSTGPRGSVGSVSSMVSNSGGGGALASARGRKAAPTKPGGGERGVSSTHAAHPLPGSVGAVRPPSAQMEEARKLAANTISEVEFFLPSPSQGDGKQNGAEGNGGSRPGSAGRSRTTASPLTRTGRPSPVRPGSSSRGKRLGPSVARRRKLRVGSGLRLTEGQLTRNEDDCALSQEWLVELLLDIIARKLDDPAVAAVWLPTTVAAAGNTSAAANTVNDANLSLRAKTDGGMPTAAAGTTGGLTVDLKPLSLPHPHPCADTGSTHGGALVLGMGQGEGAIRSAYGGSNADEASSSPLFPATSTPSAQEASRSTLPGLPTRRGSFASVASSATFTNAFAGTRMAGTGGATLADAMLSLHRARRREQKEAVLASCRAELLRWASQLSQPCTSRQHYSVWRVCEDQATMLNRFHDCLLTVNGVVPGDKGEPSYTQLPQATLQGSATGRPASSYLATRRRSSYTMTFPSNGSPHPPSSPHRPTTGTAVSPNTVSGGGGSGGRGALRSGTGVGEAHVTPSINARRRQSMVSVLDGAEVTGGGTDPLPSPPTRLRRALPGPSRSFVISPSLGRHEGDAVDAEDSAPHAEGRGGMGGGSASPLRTAPQRGPLGQQNRASFLVATPSPASSAPVAAAATTTAVAGEPDASSTPLLFFGERLDGRPSPTFRDVLLSQLGADSADPAAAVLAEGEKENALQQWRRIAQAQRLAQSALEAALGGRSPVDVGKLVDGFPPHISAAATGTRRPGGGNAEDHPRQIICWSDFSNNIIIRQPLVPLPAASTADGASVDVLGGNPSNTVTPGSVTKASEAALGVGHELAYTRVATMMLEEDHANARGTGEAYQDGDESTDHEEGLLDGVGKQDGGEAARGGAGRRRRGAAGRRTARGGGNGGVTSEPGGAAATVADLEDFAEELKVLHAQSADHVLVSTVHRLLITASKDGVVKLWETQSGLFVKNALNCGTAWVLGMYLLHDDQYLLVATSNAEITIVELPACAVIQKLRGCTSLITALKTVMQPAAHHTQRYGLKPGACGPHRLDFHASMTPETYAAMLREAQLTEGNVRVAVKPIEGYVCPTAVTLNVEHSILLFGTTEGVVGVVDLSQELKRSTLLSGVLPRLTKVANTFQAHAPGTRVMGVLFAPHARAVISCAQDGTVSRAPLSVPGLSSPNDPIFLGKPSYSAAVTAGISTTAAVTAASGTDAPRARLLTGSIIDAGEAAGLPATAGTAGASASAATLAFGPPDPLLSTQHPIRLMQYCAASKLFATVHSDRRVLLWAVGRTATELTHQLPQEAQDVVSVAFLPQEQHIALLMGDHSIRVYDYRGFRPLTVISSLQFHDNRVEEMASVTIKCSADDADGCLTFFPEKRRIVCALRGPVMYEEVQPPKDEGVRRTLTPALDEVASQLRQLALEQERLRERQQQDPNSGDDSSATDDMESAQKAYDEESETSSHSSTSRISSMPASDAEEEIHHSVRGDKESKEVRQRKRRAKRRKAKEAELAATMARVAQERRDMLAACRLQPRTSHRFGIVDLCVHPTLLELHTFSVDRWKVWDLLSGKLKRESEIPRQVRQQLPIFTRTLVTSCGWTTDHHTRLIAGARYGCIVTLDAVSGAVVNAEQIATPSGRTGPGARTVTGRLEQRAGGKADDPGPVHSGSRKTGSTLRRTATTTAPRVPGLLGGGATRVDYSESAEDLDVTQVLHVNTRTFICAGQTCVVRRYAPSTVHASGEEDYTEMRVWLPSTLSCGAGAVASNASMIGGGGALGITNKDASAHAGARDRKKHSHAATAVMVVDSNQSTAPFAPGTSSPKAAAVTAAPPVPAGAASAPATTTTITACCVVRDTHMCLGTVDSRLYFYRLVDGSGPYAEEVLCKRSGAASAGGDPTGEGAADEPEIGAVVGLFFLNDKNQNLLLVVLETGVMHVYAYLRNTTLARVRLCRAGECRIRKVIHRQVRMAGVDSALILGDSLGRVSVFDVSGFHSESVDFRRVLGKPRYVWQAAMDEISALDCFTHASAVVAHSPLALHREAVAGDSGSSVSLARSPSSSPVSQGNGSSSTHAHESMQPCQSPRGVVRLLDVTAACATGEEQAVEGSTLSPGSSLRRMGTSSSHGGTVTQTFLVVGALDGNVRLFCLGGAALSTAAHPSNSGSALTVGMTKAPLTATGVDGGGADGAPPRTLHPPTAAGASPSLSPSPPLPPRTVSATAAPSALSSTANTALNASLGRAQATVQPSVRGSHRGVTTTSVKLSAANVGLFGFDTWTLGDGESYCGEPLAESAAAQSKVDERFLDTVLESQARAKLQLQRQQQQQQHQHQSPTQTSSAGGELTLPANGSFDQIKKGRLPKQGQNPPATTAAALGTGSETKRVRVVTMEERALRRKLMHRQLTSEQFSRMNQLEATHGTDNPTDVEDSEWAAVEKDGTQHDIGDPVDARKRFAKTALALMPHHRPPSSRVALGHTTSVNNGRPFLAVTLTEGRGDETITRLGNSLGPQRAWKAQKYSRNPLVRTYPVPWLRKIGVLHPASPVPDYEAGGEPNVLPAKTAFDPTLNQQLAAAETDASESDAGVERSEVTSTTHYAGAAQASTTPTESFFMTGVPHHISGGGGGGCAIEQNGTPADSRTSLAAPVFSPRAATAKGPGAAQRASTPRTNTSARTSASAAVVSPNSGLPTSRVTSPDAGVRDPTPSPTRAHATPTSLVSVPAPPPLRFRHTNGTSPLLGGSLRNVSSVNEDDGRPVSATSRSGAAASAAVSRFRASFADFAERAAREGATEVDGATPRVSLSFDDKGTSFARSLPLHPPADRVSAQLGASSSARMGGSTSAAMSEHRLSLSPMGAAVQTFTTFNSHKPTRGLLPPPAPPAPSSFSAPRPASQHEKNAAPTPDPTLTLLEHELAGLSSAIVEERVDQLMLAHMAKSLDRLQPSGYSAGAFADGVKQVWLKRSGDAAVVAATREATAFAAGARPAPLHDAAHPRDGASADGAVDVSATGLSPLLARRDMATLRSVIDAKMQTAQSARRAGAAAGGAAETTEGCDSAPWGLDLTLAVLPTETVAARYGSRGGRFDSAETLHSDDDHAELATSKGASARTGAGTPATNAVEAHIPARERLQAHLAQRRRDRERAARERQRLEAEEEQRTKTHAAGAAEGSPAAAAAGAGPNPRRWLPQVSARQTLQPVSVTLPSALRDDESAQAQLRQLHRVASTH